MKSVLMILISSLPIANAFAQQGKSDSTYLKDTVSSNWSLTAGGYYYILPNEKNTGTFIGTADYKAWHTEARYNYEDEKTGSVFGGYRFETGDKVLFGATPMIGAVFGNTNGFAPGLELDLSWKQFDFYSENEYVFDLEEKENNFLYTWSELAITPFENFRTGLSAQRTRLFHTGFDFERGIFAQYSFWKLTSGFHYFNPLSSEYFLLATLEMEF